MATLGELCYAIGTPGPRWGTVLRLGDAWSTLGNCVTLGGRLVHAGELCYARGTPGPRWETVLRFSGVGVPEDLSACRLRSK